MQLRLGDIACGSGIGNDLAPLHPCAALHRHRIGMGVGRDVAIVVMDQHEIAVTLQFIADIGDGACGCRTHGRAARGRDIDTVIALAAMAGAEAGQNLTAHRPEECLLAREPAGLFDIPERGLGPDSAGLGRRRR